MQELQKMAKDYDEAKAPPKFGCFLCFLRFLGFLGFLGFEAKVWGVLWMQRPNGIMFCFGGLFGPTLG